MKIYFTNDSENALLYRKVMNVKSELQKLRWVKGLPAMSKEEKTSCRVLTDYCEGILEKCLEGIKPYCKTSGKEDDAVMQSFKESKTLKNCLGSCCVLAGEEAEAVLSELKRLSVSATLQEALTHGEHIMIKP